MNSADDYRLPLVVDVEGALVKTNLRHEKILQFLARNIWSSWQLLFWFVRGRRELDGRLDALDAIEWSPIVLREGTLAHIRDGQAHRRLVYLATAGSPITARRIADMIGGITDIVVDPGRGPAGEDRAAALIAAFGKGRYDYIGSTRNDFDAWRTAKNVLAVSRSDTFNRDLIRSFPSAEIIAEPRAKIITYLESLRPHQWTKNLLVFLALVAGHHFDVKSIVDTTVAFVCFCFAASSAYLINDLLDIPADRAHSRKRRRPFAAADLPISHGLILSVALLLAGFGIALTLPMQFTFILLAYVGLTLAYSFFLKRKLLVDVIVLGGLYTIRVLGGIAAAGAAGSYWLLMFCLFLFLCLATAKRCSELVSNATADTSVFSNRGYRTGDLAALFPLAAAAGYGAVLVVALYLASPEVVVLYEHPLRLWLLCPLLLYWISRVLVLASRNELHHDPVSFALGDRISWLAGATAVAIIAVAI